MMPRSFLVLVLALVICSGIDVALVEAKKQQPHPHNGVIAPFRLGKPDVVLDETATSTLAAGKPYQTQVRSEDDSDANSGRGLVVQDVNAPVSIVWERLLDFGAYPQMVPQTLESEIYHQETVGSHERIDVRMKVGLSLLKFQFYVSHLYDSQLSSMVWTLDYSKKSDLNDSVGYWYVVPHPDHPKTMSRVYYSVQLSLFRWIPKFVVDFISRQALTTATSWVKTESEKAAAKQTPSVEDDESATNESMETDATGAVTEEEKSEAEKEEPVGAQVDAETESVEATTTAEQEEETVISTDGESAVSQEETAAEESKEEVTDAEEMSAETPSEPMETKADEAAAGIAETTKGEEPDHETPKEETLAAEEL